MDQDEFARRIEVYLKLDAPGLETSQAIAEALSRRLFQYVDQPPAAASQASSALRTLLPDDALLFFTAAWDANSQTYGPVVRDVAARIGRHLVELDIDDPVSGAIAAAYRVLSTPAVATGPPGQGKVLIGARAAADLESALTE